MNAPITQLLIQTGNLGEREIPKDSKYIQWHYTSSGMLFDCDPAKNTKCPRANAGKPCGNCSGKTKYVQFAKAYDRSQLSSEDDEKITFRSLIKSIKHAFEKILNPKY